MIRDKVVDKCASISLRHRLLQETDLTLDVMIRIAHSIEASDVHASTIEAATAGTSNQQVNRISTGSQRPQKKRNRARQPWNVKNGSSKTPV